MIMPHKGKKGSYKSTKPGHKKSKKGGKRK